MNVLGYQVKNSKGYYLDVPFLIKTYLEIYEKSNALPYLENHIDELNWEEDDIERAKEIIVEIKNEDI